MVCSEHTRRGLVHGALVATLALGLGLPGLANAQGAADIRRLEIIIPLSAGGGSDILVRRIAEELRSRMGSVPIAIQNVPGDGSLLGLSRVARFGPDQAVLGAHNPPNTVLSQLARGANAPVDIRELTPIAAYGRTFTVVATAADSGIRTFADLQAAYASGGRNLFGGTDRAGSSELTAMLLRDQVALPFGEYIAYDGSGAMNSALIRNEIPAGLASYDAVVAGMAAGTLHPLLVLGARERQAGMPDTPTAIELGYPSLAEVAAPIRVIVAQPGVNPAIRDYLVDLFATTLTDPDVVARLAAERIAIEYMPPEEVDAAIRGAFAALEDLPILRELMSR